MKTLLFIDTNILLDFYRVRNDFSKQFVGHIEKIADSLICTYQVEMEFKKNRQAAVLDGMSSLKPPASVPRPCILSDDRSYRALTDGIKKAGRRVKVLHERLGRILEDPIRNDPIYRVLQRVFRKVDGIALQRGTPTAHRIRRLALKRFLLGYPPRKKNDTSTGDAVNWEWIVDCAQREKAGVLIVSRDADYGVERDGKGHVNDWLREEFRDRVSKKARLRMTPLLAEALREFKVPVSNVAAKREMSLVRSGQSQAVKKPSDFVAWVRSLSKEEARDAIDSRVADSISDIIETEYVSGIMAETNAVGWDVDDYSIEDFDLDDDPIEVSVSFHAAGEQLDDKMCCGTEMRGKATARIDSSGVVEYEVFEADIVHDE